MEDKRLHQRLPVEANKFTSQTGNVVRVKKQAKIFSNIKVHQLNVMLVGPLASGKTLAVVALLKHGLKVLHINTDLGTTGLMTVRNKLAKEDLSNLESNLVTLDIDTYEEMWQFLENPESFFPDIYKFGFDVLFWDGFANYHHSHIGNKVADMIPERKGEVSEQRESGLQMEVQDWGMIKSATLKSLDKFFRLHNKVDGKVWHKIVTCQPKYFQRKPKPGEKGEYVETIQVNLSGASQIIMGAAFDLIIYCKIQKSLTTDKVEYKYITSANGDNCCKNREFDLLPEEPADFYKLWEKITTQGNYLKDAKDENLVEK